MGGGGIIRTPELLWEFELWYVGLLIKSWDRSGRAPRRGTKQPPGILSGPGRNTLPSHLFLPSGLWLVSSIGQNLFHGGCATLAGPSSLSWGLLREVLGEEFLPWLDCDPLFPAIWRPPALDCSQRGKEGWGRGQGEPEKHLPLPHPCPPCRSWPALLPGLPCSRRS